MSEDAAQTQPKKRWRGPGKKPSMIHVNLRIPQYVYDFYFKYDNVSDVMRKVLAEFVDMQAAYKQAVEEGEKMQQESEMQD